MTEPTTSRSEQTWAPFLALREPFPPEQVGKLPRGGITLDYVGHGAVTSRLLEVDPWWNWEPVASDPQGFPVFDTNAKGEYTGLWIKLTVCGVTRLGYGSVPGATPDAAKQLIGDALRNAAMRFGVALDLWIKGHSEDNERNVPQGPRAAGRDRQEEDPLVTEDRVQRFYLTAAKAGFDEVDVGDMVGRVALTSGPADPASLRMSEWPLLRDEFKRCVAAKESASPVTPQGEGAPAPEASTGAPRAVSEGGPPAPTEPEPQSVGGRGRARIGSKATEASS